MTERQQQIQDLMDSSKRIFRVGQVMAVGGIIAIILLTIINAALVYSLIAVARLLLSAVPFEIADKKLQLAGRMLYSEYKY
jgi:hypothetical protein